MKPTITHVHITMAEAVFLHELGHLPARPVAKRCEMIDVDIKVFTSETTAVVFTALVPVDESLAHFREELQEEARRLRATIESRLQKDGKPPLAFGRDDRLRDEPTRGERAAFAMPEAKRPPFQKALLTIGVADDET